MFLFSSLNNRFELIRNFQIVLSSGKFELKVFKILGKTSSSKCIEFLRRQQATFIGQEVIFFVQKNIEQFPSNCSFVSFDESCLQDGADIYDDHVPVLFYSHPKNVHIMDLNKFCTSYDKGWCLLCCCKK